MFEIKINFFCRNWFLILNKKYKYLSQLKRTRYTGFGKNYYIELKKFAENYPCVKITLQS